MHVENLSTHATCLCQVKHGIDNILSDLEQYAIQAVYELKIDTDGDAVADIAYRVRFTSDKNGAQTATLRRVEGGQAADTGDDGQTAPRLFHNS